MSGRTASYLSWPDARLRAFLRNNGVSDASLPTTREELLREYPDVDCALFVVLYPTLS